MMRILFPRVGATSILVAALLLVGSVPAWAIEPFGSYDPLSSKLLRSDRWRGGEDFGGQEVARGVGVGGPGLLMRLRRQGETTSNEGSVTAGNFLDVRHPTSITEIMAWFVVDELDMLPVCAANNASGATRARPARLLIARFNDGTSTGPGDRTGDYFAGVQAQRDGSTTDPANVLQIFGFIAKFTNPSASTSTTISTTPLLAKVNVGDTFTLRVIWDKPNHRFLFGVNNLPNAVLTYAASDTAEAAVPFVNAEIFHTVANCTAGPREIFSDTFVSNVFTNASGVVP